MADKKYCGCGKVKVFQNGSEMLRLSFKADDVSLLANNLKDGWVNINISKRKEPSKLGMTHYGYIDDWLPQGKSDQAEAGFDSPPPKREAAKPDGDLPF
jgi:hypothetical protein